MTGFSRNGFCDVPPEDYGVHAVCAVMTDEFLKFTKEQGNDLSTSVPEWGFPGLREGDRWCLCASRWQEAFLVGKAPLVVLEATHEAALEIISLEDLRSHAASKEEDDPEESL